MTWKASPFELAIWQSSRLTASSEQKQKPSPAKPRRMKKAGEYKRSLQEALSLSCCAAEIYSRLKSSDLQSAQETLAENEEKVKENSG